MVLIIAGFNLLAQYSKENAGIIWPFSKTITAAVGALFFLISTQSAFANNDTVIINKTPTKAPSFTIKSGDDIKLNETSLLGKITIIYYDSQDTVSLNHEIKKALRQWRLSLTEYQRKQVTILPVIDASSANFLTSGIWASRLRSKSEEMGYQIYGDWNGNMAKTWKFAKETSYLSVADPNVQITLRAIGKISEQDFKQILAVISNLFNDLSKY
ncbi:MAG: hypothetical protein JW841_07835 [Deltaproteobacteria bacterium]|nr:hypothetical protein [Deltaproteobacteria bacterium]